MSLESKIDRLLQAVGDINAKFDRIDQKKEPAVSSVAKRTLSVREVWGSIPGPANLHSVANDSPPLRRFF